MKGPGRRGPLEHTGDLLADDLLRKIMRGVVETVWRHLNRWRA